MSTLRRAAAFTSIVTVLAVAGCRSRQDTTRADIQSAITGYYKAHPSCLWPSSVQFPTNFDSSSPKTDAYDALVDEGYLTRIQSTKKVFIFGSKQVSNYDLSDKGRGIWTPDPQQVGYGNFCYGHRSATQVDSVTPAPVPDQDYANGSSVTATYDYAIDAASWANNDKIKSNFPGVASAVGGPQQDSATLTKTGDRAWQVAFVPSAANPLSPAHNAAPELGPKSNDYGAVGDKKPQ